MTFLHLPVETFQYKMNPDEYYKTTSNIERNRRNYFLKFNTYQGVGPTHIFWFSARMTQRVQQKKWREERIEEKQAFNIQDKLALKIRKLRKSQRLEKMRREQE